MQPPGKRCVLGAGAAGPISERRAHSRRRTQALDHVVKYMGEMKTMLYGDAAADKAPKDEEGKLLAQEAAKSKLLTHMCSQLAPLGFEARAVVRCLSAARA